MSLNCITFLYAASCLCLVSLSEATVSTFEWRRNDVYENVTSTANRIRTVTAQSKLKCSRECLETTGCAAFFHNRQLQVCQIHSSDSFGSASLLASPGTSFYSNVCMKYDYTYDADLRKYYMRYTSPTQTKTGAELACNLYGGTLISLSRKEEFQSIGNILSNITQINKYHEAFWVGAEVNNGTFKWNDGAVVDMAFWEQGQPEYNPSANVTTECVLLMPIYDYKLDDYKCIISSSLKIYPLCECSLKYM